MDSGNIVGTILANRGRGWGLEGTDVRLAPWLPGKPAERHALHGSFDKLHSGDVCVCVYVCVCTCTHFDASVMSNSVRSYGLQPGRLLCPLDSPGKNAGVGCHALLRGSSQHCDRTRVS